MTRIPLPGNMIDTLMKGVSTGSNMYSGIMNPIISRENMANTKKIHDEQLAQQWKTHLDDLALRRQQESRLGANMGLQRQLLQEQLLGLKHKNDPNWDFNNKMSQIQNLMSQRQGGQQGVQGAQQPQMPEDYMSLLKGGPELPQGGEALMRPQEQQTQGQGGQLPGGVDMDDIIKGLMYKSVGLHAPSGGGALTGPARDAESMERLRQRYGNDSRMVRDAESMVHAKSQQQEDLSAIRQRQLTGLKPGDTEIKDPETGEIIGFNKQTTEKQKDSAKNQSLFNSLYPLAYNGGSPFVGAGAALKLEETIKNAKSDPVARKRLIDFMLAEKALTNTTVTEAARFNSGRTNQTYNRYAESLKTENIHPKLKKWLKEYGIGEDINREVGRLWQDELNKAEKKANKSIPATMAYYFNPDKQFAHEQKMKQEDSGDENEDNDPLRIR